MSIQAGWNSALGIFAGLDYLKQLKEGQTRTLYPYKKPGLDIDEEVKYQDVAGVRKAMKEEGIEVGSGTDDEKAFDKQLDDLAARKVAKNSSVFEDYPEEVRKKAISEQMGLYEGALKGVSPKEIAIKKALQSFADNPVAVNLYNAPKNTMKGAMDALMKTKQQGYENIMKGGGYNG